MSADLQGPLPADSAVETFEHEGVRFTKTTYERFKALVDDTGHASNFVRVVGRQNLRTFVEKNGRDLCDAMYGKLKADHPGLYT